MPDAPTEIDQLLRSAYEALDGDGEDSASVRENAVDAHGRRGVEVVFEDRRERDVPRYEVTARELVDPFRGGPQPIEGLDEIDGDRVYVIDDNRVERWWRVGIIVDVERGELLQEYSFRLRRMHGTAPRFVTLAEGPRILVKPHSGGGWQVGGRTLLARDFVTEIEPALPLCREHPKVCR